MSIDAALGRLGIKSGVCTSSTRPTNPYSGQLIYETDTNRTLVYDNAAWLVVADNQVLSIDTTNSRVGINDTSPSYALDVNGDINATGDLCIGGAAIGTWTEFTPTWTFSANAITTAQSFGRYMVLNDIVIIKVYMRYSSKAGGGSLRVTVPAACSITPPSAYDRLGYGAYYDVSASTNRTLNVYHNLNSTTEFQFLYDGGAAVADTVPVTMGINDEIHATLIGLKA